MADSATPTERYADGLENLRVLVARFPQLLKHQSRLQRDIQKDYLESTAAVRKLTAAESSRLDKLDPSRLAKVAAAEKARRIELQKRSGQGAGLADQRRLKEEERNVAASRRLLKERLADFKKQRHEQARVAAKAIEAEKQLLRQEQAIMARRNELRKRSGQGARLADQRRLKEEHKSVREHRALLQKRLMDRQRYNEQMRAKIRQSLKYHQDENQAFRTSGGVGGAAGGVGRAGGGMGLVRGGGALLAAGLLVRGAYEMKEFGRESVAMSADVQRSTAAFEVFTGSAAGAGAMMKNLRTLAADAGVSFDAIQGSATTLMSFGVSAEETIPSLERMANITRGDPERFKAMSLAYAQTQAAGKLMGQELLQMVNAGFNPLMEISRKTGKSITELRKDMEAGEISAEDIADAFESATGAGGKYNGMLEKMAATTSGALNRSKSAWEVAMVDTGDALQPLTRAWARLSTGVAEDVSRQAQNFQEFTNSIFGTTKAVEEQTEAVEELTDAQQRLLERRKMEAAIFAEQRKAQADARKHADEQLGELSFSAARDAMGDRFGPFGEVLSLLDDPTKAQAKLDLSENFGTRKADIFAQDYLTKEQAAELKRIQDLKKQTEELEKQRDLRNEFMAEGKRLSASLVEDSLGQKLGKLGALRQMGSISSDDLRQLQSRALDESMSDFQAPQLASNALRGSQEAYQIITNAQNSVANQQLKESQRQTKLQESQLAAEQEQHRILSELVDKMPEIGVL